MLSNTEDSKAKSLYLEKEKEFSKSNYSSKQNGSEKGSNITSSSQFLIKLITYLLELLMIIEAFSLKLLKLLMIIRKSLQKLLMIIRIFL